jgi:hypothetical protein
MLSQPQKFSSLFFKLGMCTLQFLLLTFYTEECPTAEMNSIDLNIPDRKWDPTRPNKNVGWCAEVCIQMAMAYYGFAVSQKCINKAGMPKHSDLYMDDIIVALKQLHVKYISWRLSDNNLHKYISWIKDMLSLRYPVICGVKIYPDENPQWFLDHFVLIVGYDETGFLVNTNMYGQKRISYRKITSGGNNISFKNKQHTYFAIAIIGVEK